MLAAEQANKEGSMESLIETSLRLWEVEMLKFKVSDFALNRMTIDIRYAANADNGCWQRNE